MLLLLAGTVLALTSCSGKGPASQAKKEATVYTCVMHHQIRRDKPGDCPICGMTLVPVEKVEGPSTETPEKPLAGPSGEKYGTPEAVQGLAPVRITPYQEHLIGIKFAVVKKAPITRSIQTTGRFGGGAGDFAALSGDFAAQRPVRSSARYGVADVYALDVPFVRVGQRAWVSALSGSGPRVEGKVSFIYPYDQTQSRVTRVKIGLSQAPPPDIFANVTIEAVLPPRLAVPPTAVMDTGTRRYVFLQTAPGEFIPRIVTTGFEGDDLWEVTSGLKEGDQVADGANFLLDADSKIQAAFAEEQK